MPAVYHATGKLPGGNTDGFRLIQLACSRDLRTWNRLGDRRPFLGPSRVADDVWDLTQLLPPSAPVVRDNELWFYYTGIRYREKPAQADDKAGAVCLAVLRRDGFVSLAATHDPGSVTTKPFTWPDGSLHLNVDATQGEVRVSMLDSTGRTTAQSRLLRGDRLAGQVQFDKRAAVGARVSLKFTLQDCNLYSFWFALS